VDYGARTTVALTLTMAQNANTKGVLAALKRYEVKATFFIVGNMASAHHDCPRGLSQPTDIFLGNHTATHPRLGAKYANNPSL